MHPQVVLVLVIEVRERAYECVHHDPEDEQDKREHRDGPENCPYVGREHHWTS
jgi:hypothetical protein